MPDRYSVILKEKKFLAADTIFCVFSKPQGFSFEAGQFVQFSIHKDGKYLLRAYSIASIPQDTDLAFCIKLHTGGVGAHFFETLSVGQAAPITGPFGRFICEEEGKNITFVATGVGLSPIFSMIRDLLETQISKQSIHLLFGARTEEDILWKKELEALQNTHPNFSFVITLSQPSEKWAGLHGRVTDHILGEQDAGAYYICGNPDMIRDTKKLLESQGVQKKDIHFEIF